MKILYNVTVKIEGSLTEDWLQWMKEVHLPEVMQTGCFESYLMSRIDGDDDEHGVGFAIQYIATTIEQFDTYQSNHAKILQKAHSDRYANRYVAFRTLMRIEAQG